MRLYNADRLGWTEKAAELGPIAGMRLGPVTTVVLSDPDGARSVLITDASSWKRPPATTIPIRMAVGENLLTQADEAWSKLQPSLAPDFRKRAIDPRLADIEGLLSDEISALPHGITLDIDEAMGRLAMTVAAWVLFGERLERDQADQLLAHQRELIQWTGNRLGTLRSLVPLAPGRPGRAMRRHRAAAESFVGEFVTRRRQQKTGRGDLLDALLAARPGGRPLTDKQLRSHVLGLLGAGNETTAAALSWAIVHGAAHPEEWSAVRSDPSLAQHYMAETLRLSPPGWGFTRLPTHSRASIPVGGSWFRIRRFQAVAVNIWGMNRDPKIWPDPTRFDPGRHRSLTKTQERSMLPFSLGPRGCIGQHLAMAEMLMVLPMLARHGDVHVHGPAVEDPTFTLRVKGGVHARFVAPSPH